MPSSAFPAALWLVLKQRNTNMGAVGTCPHNLAASAGAPGKATMRRRAQIDAMRLKPT
eukprot:CAMPEP_0115515464 /NCGR_PEP_ID=MMETSP0271-20121206/76237_1 /TAXON_ID=71861 /ORGANISM="Scrippsiella trochoidea, Strain CCMP3099" /LENGTH=57 /DNA_ID=CAMNT_0002946051 /DNA_START=20 /DNA_END=190 /DNA_ORIENTATION=+